MQNSGPKTSSPSGRIQEGTFQLSLLKKCSPLVRKCYGCQRVLKLRRGEELFIPEPPGDLVIISCMRRSYWQDGEMKTGKLGNVYFHCKVECVKLVQPAFIPFLVVISPEIKRDLLDVHRHFLQNDIGIV